MYLHQRKQWWDFRYDRTALVKPLVKVWHLQGYLYGTMDTLGFEPQGRTILDSLSTELVKSSEIEGKLLNMDEVRSSIATRLGIKTAGLVQPSRYVQGIVEMLLDATQHYDQQLSDGRLFGWHNALFPDGVSGAYQIEVAKYRTGEMQVVSGPMGKESVHYQAPGPERVPEEMARFIEWFNAEPQWDPVIKAGIAHLWFVSIHPFDDGNGRIARALTDMLLARAEGSKNRYYSMSGEIKQDLKNYYDVLERTQKGEGDITEWLLWFLECLARALEAAQEAVNAVYTKNRFWESHLSLEVNERQRKVINMLFDGFFGKLTSSKWAKINKCSADTALLDIKDLIAKGVLAKDEGGGRSTSYSLLTDSYTVQDCYRCLENIGWSEHIDIRWKDEVIKDLRTHLKGLSDDVLQQTLDLLFGGQIDTGERDHFD